MLNQPFFQVALPIMVTLIVTIWAANWLQNKRIEDLRGDIKEFKKEVLDKLKDLDERIKNLEVAKWR